MYLFELEFSPNNCPRVQLLMVIVFLVFWGTSLLFSIVVVPFYSFTNTTQGSPFLHMFANICYFFSFSFSFFFDSSHPDEWASLIAQTVKNLPAMQETCVQPLVRKIPWRREWLTTAVFLPGKSHGQRSLQRRATVMWLPRVRHDWATTTFTTIIYVILF